MAYDLGGYVDVPTRLRLALKDWPKLRIQETSCTLEQVGEQLFMVCVVTVWRDETDPIPVIASAAEQIPGRTPYTRNAERMVGFTSALGRALGYMGYGIDKSIASHDEIKHRQDAPEDPWPLTEQQEQKRALSQIVEKEANKRKMVSSNGPMTVPQSKMLKIQAKKAGFADDDALTLFCAETLGEDLAGLNGLTKVQASKCIEALIKQANKTTEPETEVEEPF
jgi:hypothetical protein